MHGPAYCCRNEPVLFISISAHLGSIPRPLLTHPRPDDAYSHTRTSREYYSECFTCMVRNTNVVRFIANHIFKACFGASLTHNPVITDFEIETSVSASDLFPQNVLELSADALDIELSADVLDIELSADVLEFELRADVLDFELLDSARLR
jgi:hypothetical protein